MALRVQINFELPRIWPPRIGRAQARSLLRRAARAVFSAEGLTTAELTITLLDDEAIASLNRQYLDHAGPTDVIAFALHAPGEPPLGDLYIGWDQALRQAASHGEEPAVELARLAVHGTLHILGYDHPEGTEREAGSMWRYQENILRKVIGISA
jgi:probable rRNA maturation factor